MRALILNREPCLPAGRHKSRISRKEKPSFAPGGASEGYDNPLQTHVTSGGCGVTHMLDRPGDLTVLLQPGFLPRPGNRYSLFHRGCKKYPGPGGSGADRKKNDRAGPGWR